MSVDFREAVGTVRDSGDPKPSRNLATRSISALKWNYAGVAFRAFCQLAVGVVLARLLGPEPFGIVALAMLFIGVCNLFADSGLASALVQREQIDDQDVRFVFTCQVVLGAALTVAGLLLVQGFASFFGSPDSVAPMRAMLCLFIIQALGQTSVALLRKSLDFRSIQQISVGSYLIGYLLIGIPAAVAGLGVWSLVLANLSQVSMCTVGYVLRAHAPLGWASKPSSSGLVQFGFKVVAANLSSWLIMNLDSLFIGRMLGVNALGLYNRALTLVASPTGAFVTGLQGVLFAACSRAQRSQGKLQRAYLGATTAVALVCLPLFLSVAAVSDSVILVLYGHEWSGAAPALVPLALAMPLMAMLALAGPLLASIDRVSKEVRAQVITLALLWPLIYLASGYSMVAVAWVMLLGYGVRWALLTNAVLSALGLGWRQLEASIRIPFALAVAIALAAVSVDRGMQVAGWNVGARLPASLVAAGAVLALGLRLLGSRLLSGHFGEFLRSRGPMPRALARLLNIE